GRRSHRAPLHPHGREMFTEQGGIRGASPHTRTGVHSAAVAPEILIVGDRAHRGELIPRVQDLGYPVSPVRERELLLRVAQTPGPGAVIVCLGDADASGLVRSLRE